MKQLIGLCFVVLIIIACGGNGNYTYELIREETHSWSSVGITSVEATTVNGDIEVSSRQDTTITLDVRKRCFGEDSLDAEEHIALIEIATQINSGVLEVDADMPSDEDRSYQASFDFRMPDDIYVDLVTLNGDVAVKDMIGGAKIQSTNGSLRFQNFAGNADADTENGSIDCEMNVVVATDIITLSSENGNAIVNMPSDAAVTFDLRTTNGSITISDFTNVVYTINEAHHKTGTINGGGATLDVTLTNGDVLVDG